MTTSDDVDWLAALVAEVAAQEIMPRFRRLADDDIHQKSGPADLVTAADVAAELAITSALSARFPQAHILGEEAVASDPSMLEDWYKADLAFTIDPVDGTFNFASGVPVFGVMIAVVRKGETVAGILFDPVGGDWVLAQRGAGARYRSSDGRERRLSVAEPAPVERMTSVVSWQYFAGSERAKVARNQTACLAGANYRCAAQEYRLLSQGALHFALYNKLMPWDHLPGVLIHAEAGGYARRFDGSVYGPEHLSGGLLVATDAESWMTLRDALWRD